MAIGSVAAPDMFDDHVATVIALANGHVAAAAIVSITMTMSPIAIAITAIGSDTNIQLRELYGTCGSGRGAGKRRNCAQSNRYS